MAYSDDLSIVIESEFAVAGAILADIDSWPLVASLRPDDFADPLASAMHAYLGEAIRSGSPLGLESLALKLDPFASFHEYGGKRFLFDLYDRAPAPATIPALVAEIATNASRRRVQQNLRSQLSDDEFFSILDEEKKRRQSIGHKRISFTPYEFRPTHEIPRRRWVYGRHLLRRYVSLTVAPGGMGKSSLAVVEALAMVTGRNLLGDHPHETCRVWYWNGEDDDEETERRLAAACRHYGITEKDIGGRLMINSGRQLDLTLAASSRDGYTVNETVLSDLEREILEHQIDVIVIDPLVAAHQVAENDNSAVAALVRALSKLAENTSCAVELVHHIRKPGGGVKQDTDVNDARGASALIGGVRSARVLNPLDKAEADRLGIKDRLSYFRVDSGKSNLAKRTEDGVWRQLISIDMDNGGGLTSDLVGVVASWEPPGLFAGVTVHDTAEVQRLVDLGEYRLDVQAKQWVGLAVGEAMSWDSTDKDVRKKIKAMVDVWISNGILVVEHRPDAKREMKSFVVSGEPIDVCRT